MHIKGESVLWNDELGDTPQFSLSMTPAAGYYNLILSKLTACYEYKSFWSYWNVKGYLTNEKTGEPLRDQKVLIYQFTSDGYVLRSVETTDDQDYFYYSRYASTLGSSTSISLIYDGNWSYLDDGVRYTVIETYSQPAKCA